MRTDLGPLSRIACAFISVVFSQPQRVPRLIHITEASLVPDQALGAHRCGASARARNGPSLTSDFNHSQLIVSMCRNPNFAWAQRKDRVFVTIEVPNCDKKASTVNIEGQSLKFKGKTDTQEWELDIELYGELNTEVRPAGRIGCSVLLCTAAGTSRPPTASWCAGEQIHYRRPKRADLVDAKGGRGALAATPEGGNMSDRHRAPQDCRCAPFRGLYPDA